MLKRANDVASCFENSQGTIFLRVGPCIVSVQIGLNLLFIFLLQFEQFSDILVATIENNLGLTYKELKAYDNAKECYLNAALIRK